MKVKRFKVVSCEEAVSYESKKIVRKEQAIEFLRMIWETDLCVCETFYLLTLDGQNQITGFAKIAEGGRTSVVVDIAMIAKYSIETLSRSIILAHNHPSGRLQASEADIKITRKVQEAMKLFGIDVLDHIIITENSALSLADEGLM